MAKKFICIAALILELNGVFNFDIAKSDQLSDIYKIEEDPKTHTLTITNPKAEKPTLREIIYYHIIEKPYDQVNTQYNNLSHKDIDEKSLVYDKENENSNFTKIKGIIEIKGDNINYLTGSTDILNNGNSIITNGLSQLSQAHKTRSKINISVKQNITTALNNRTTIISENIGVDSNEIPDHLSEIEKIQINDQSSSQNTKLFEQYDDSETKRNNFVSSQVHSKQNFTKSNELVVLNSTSTNSNDTNVIEHNDVRRIDETSTDHTKEHKTEITGNISSIQNATLKHSTSDKTARKKIFFQQTTVQSINVSDQHIQLEAKNTKKTYTNVTENSNVTSSIVKDNVDVNSSSDIYLKELETKSSMNVKGTNSAKYLHSTYKNVTSNAINSMMSNVSTEKATLVNNILENDHLISNASFNSENTINTLKINVLDGEKINNKFMNAMENKTNITINNEIRNMRVINTTTNSSETKDTSIPVEYKEVTDTSIEDINRKERFENTFNRSRKDDFFYKINTADSITLEMQKNNSTDTENHNKIGSNEIVTTNISPKQKADNFHHIIENNLKIKNNISSKTSALEKNVWEENNKSTMNSNKNTSTYTLEDVKNDDNKIIELLYTNQSTTTSNYFNTILDTDDFTNDDDRMIYVYNDYDNPFEGKEGVNYTARQFTNGHGYQYFYPHPEEQINDERNYESYKNNINATNVLNQLTDPNQNSLLGTIVVRDNDELDSREDEDDKSKSNESLYKSASSGLLGLQEKTRTKRNIRTQMSVTEDVGPEDMYKDVVDKISDRLKRSLREEGDTYGMTLTGDRGVIWNDFNKEKMYFPVGENSNDAEIKYNTNPQQVKTTNEETNTKLHGSNYKKLRNKNDLTKDLNIVKTNYGEYNNSVSTITKAKEWNVLYNNAEDRHNNNMTDYHEEKRIEELNEINHDDNNDYQYDKSLEEYNIVKNEEEDFYGHKPSKISFEKLPGKTFGMSLIGGRGNIWNDLGDRKLSYQVGEPTLDQDSRSEDNTIIDSKIAAFQNFLRGAPSVSSSQKKEPQVSRPNTVTRNNMKDSQLSLTEHKTIINSRTENPINLKPLKQSQKQTSEVVDIVSYSPLEKTYGMSIIGDNGTVWNDLNGRRVSYQVGENNATSALVSKTNKDDEKIDAKIAQFHKSLKEAASTTDIDVAIITTEKPTTEKPVVIEPLTEEPIVFEPSSDEFGNNRPTVIEPTTEGAIITEESTSYHTPEENYFTAKNPESKENITVESSTENPDDTIKTYGMSLTGDQGLVWNDLNGGRVSYHVGSPVEESKEPHSEATTSKPNQNNKDKTDNLLNEIDEVLNEIDNILEDMAEETDTPKEENYKEELDNLIDIIKEVFANESAKLDEKINLINNQNGNTSEKNNTNTDDKKENQSFFMHELVDNDDFRKWLNNWSSTNTELLMNKVDEYIKKEVERQIEEYFATQNKTELSGYSHEESAEKEIIENKDSADDELSKKRKDCDNKKDKESDIHIAATNVYGSSVGNKNVTNVFIFNVNKISDLNNNPLMPLINGTDGVYVFGNHEEPDTNFELEELNANADKESTEESNESTPEDEKNTEAPNNLEESLADGINENLIENIVSEKNNSAEIIDNKNDGDKQFNVGDKNTENSNEFENTDITDKPIVFNITTVNSEETSESEIENTQNKETENLSKPVKPSSEENTEEVNNTEQSNETNSSENKELGETGDINNSQYLDSNEKEDTNSAEDKTSENLQNSEIENLAENQESNMSRSEEYS